MTEGNTSNDKTTKKSHKGRWFVIGLIAFFVIIGISNSKSSTQPVASTTTATATTAPAPKSEYKLGEVATADDRSVAVTNVQRNYSTGNTYEQPESGKEYVVVTVQVANNGKDAVDYNTYDFKIQDSNGVQLTENAYISVEGELHSGSLAPGGKVTGKLSYQVPAGDKGLKLLFDSSSFFHQNVITFDL